MSTAAAGGAGGGAVHSGWVMKRAVRTATKNDWKRRWLVLTPTAVSYYENNTAKKPKNSLPLTAQCRIRPCEYHFKQEFELYNPGSGVAFYATTETVDQLNTWIVRSVC